MTSVIILGFLAGALFINGLPYLVRGAAGKTHKGQFGGNSSAVVSVFWGWANWVVAVLAWHVAPMKSHPRAAFVAAAAGVLLVGWCLSAYMGKNAKAK